jgi:hypothetical protein
MNEFHFMVLAVLVFVPPLIGYARRLGHGSMIRVWLWLALPFIGWLVSLGIALTDPPRKA